MTTADFEHRAAAGEPFSAAEAAQVLASPDLTTVGHLGELARKHASGNVITFSRVVEVTGGRFPASAGDAGEVRLVGVVSSIDDAVELVGRGRSFAGTVTLTGVLGGESFRAVRPGSVVARIVRKPAS